MTSLIDHAKPSLGRAETTEAEAKRLTSAFAEETKDIDSWSLKPKDHAAGRAALDGPLEMQVAVLVQLCECMAAGPAQYHEVVSRLDVLASALFARSLPCTASDLERMMVACRLPAENRRYYVLQRWGGVARVAQRFVDAGNTLTPPMREQLALARTGLVPYNQPEFRKVKRAVSELLGDTQADLPDLGERWADAARAEAGASAAWIAVFTHAATADGGKPSAKWLAEAEKNRQAVGEAAFRQRVAAWLMRTAPPAPLQAVRPMHPTPEEEQDEPNSRAVYADASKQYYAYVQEYMSRISEKNLTILKGLAWYSSVCDSAELARAVGHLAEAGFENVRERGAWAKSAGNAAIWALGRMPGGVGVAPLARLRTRLRDRSALKLIAASIEAAAQSAGMTVDELEDLAVPTGGLGADGTRREVFGVEAERD